VAYGSAAAGLPGTTIPTPAHLRTELVQVRPLDQNAVRTVSTSHQRTEEK
jgi:1-phosphofructokinase